MIKLIGVLVVAAGFALRFNTLLVVLAAGIATGLVAGMPMTGFSSGWAASRITLLKNLPPPSRSKTAVST